MTVKAQPIESLKALLALYGTPGAPSLRKVAQRLTPLYRKWIMASRFCVLSTVGAEGTDASPRGEDGPVVIELDPGTLAMPDWRGNNRLDSLRNIVTDGRVSLMFVVPGSNNVVRLNGQAWLTADLELRRRFAKGERLPATVIIIEIGEIYTQCARAMMRAELWRGVGRAADVPTVGQILAEVSDGEEGGAPYDAAWSARAAKTMW
ncbi:pyridoxamine 5'-phosphate oxidase family protein [Roseobacter sinensis]|uniref:Pyridoxamine 5'-phosphate oxidase family protein n=1 Tax=Roseobacter sinensis TaxID=2931391 RepID=A0ABT3BF28_9RHOB|nr:pyridoxamine 5'-phosphate oxidase family protein [Roseobacter sp. WL0113]MCV3272178.1 pyridoxamine 5'-phosphate oxidase family protein [Roseobacter sp. WL0113]